MPNNNHSTIPESQLNAAAIMEELLYSISERTENADDIPRGIENMLKAHMRRLKQMRSFANKESLIRIGVFGTPKQGKSSLLNALLGVDILPTRASPASNTRIELHDEEQPVDVTLPWTATLYYGQRYHRQERHESVDGIRECLEKFGAHDHDSLEPDLDTPERIKVTGPFHRTSREVFRNSCLIDTPGVETAFLEAPEDSQDNAHVSEANRYDGERAIKALKEAHVILFCNRLDLLQAENAQRLYKEYIREFAPLHILTFLDKWNLEKSGDPERFAFKQLDYPQDKTLCISSLWANQSLFEAADAKEKSELWHKSNFDNLERRIGDELDSFRPLSLFPAILNTLVTIYKDDEWRFPVCPEPLHLDLFEASLNNVLDDSKNAGCLKQIQTLRELSQG